MKCVRFISAQYVLLMATIVFAGGLFGSNSAWAANGNCQAIQLSVALAAGQPANQTISATYCQPFTWADGTHEIDILTAGATYTSLYWDWTQNPALYSYVDKTLQAGRATFNYDRIGTGASSLPLSAAVSVQGEAFILHQIVTWVHNQGFSQVNLVGHSYGSIVTLHEAGTYQDATRVVVTGLTHVPNNGLGLAETLASLYPAALDPEFAGQGLDIGYLTTEPGTRGPVFYSSSADPAVIAFDEAHKNILSSATAATFPTNYGVLAPLNASDSITVPVLVILGQQDVIFCTSPGAFNCASDSSLAAAEAPYYVSTPSLTAELVPDTGHDIALHPSANTSFSMINSWINTH